MKRFFWEEVTVIKMMARKKKREVWPKRLTCCVGLSQTEEMTLAMTRIINGEKGGRGGEMEFAAGKVSDTPGN